MAVNALSLVHKTLSERLKKGDLVIDATAGRGYDTCYLASLVGKEGKVIAIDIQEEAVNSTREMLDKEGLSAEVILDSHANMDKYALPDTVDAIVFNLGYLPKGNHAINTKASSTIEAITKGLVLLKKGGIICVSMYYGGDSGYEEKNALTEWLKTLDHKTYQVIMTLFYNWENDPPIPVFIIKN